MSKKKVTYQVRESGSALFVMDGGRPFILQRTETRLDPTVGNGIECDFQVVDVIIPYGADKDKSFVNNISKTKSIKKVKDICKSWKNI